MTTNSGPVPPVAPLDQVVGDDGAHGRCTGLEPGVVGVDPG